jgi:hypothetical protein
LIKQGSVAQAAMTFDESITLHNSDGEHVVPSSSRNTIEMAGLCWDDVPIAVARNMTHREDAIIGNTLFRTTLDVHRCLHLRLQRATVLRGCTIMRIDARRGVR